MAHTMVLTGTRTMLTHNIQLGDPDNHIVKQISRLNALKSKITDEQRAERDYLKWLGGLYWDEQLGPILPAANVFKSLRDAAALTRNGRDVERGVIMLDLHARLDYAGPRTLAAMWGNGSGPNVDRRMARVNSAPVVAVRPCYAAGWSAAFDFEIDEDVLSLDDLRLFADKAGRLVHVGDYRRFYGAYEVEIS
jgi:hypothetical protein